MSTSIRDEIRRVLLQDWDPSNAARSEFAQNTYDAYIDPIIELIQSNATEDAVIDYLYDREREIMCFPGLGKQRLRRIAQKLLAIRAN